MIRARIPTLVLTLVLASPAALRATTPHLVWSDEFSGAVGTAPDPAKWTYDLGVGSPPGWGNNELEDYTNSLSNCRIVSDPGATDGRALSITAIDANGSYTSSRINTVSSYSFKYGRIEARARVPSGAGLWPAFWALGSDFETAGWPGCGEIDVMEWVGSLPDQIAGSMHAVGYSGGNALTAAYSLPTDEAIGDAYHVFAADWYPNEIVFSVDGVVYEDRKESQIPGGSQWPFDAPFFIILNLAVGGDWPGPPNASTQFPQSFLVDYVRVYSLPSSPPPGLAWPPAPPTGLSAFAESASPVVNVAWQAPATTFGAALSGYRLRRATDSAMTQNVSTWALGLSTTFVDTSAAAGTAYYYQVSAMSANGASDPSAAAASTVNAEGADSSLLNISTRGVVGTGGNILIAGFVVSGPSPKTVLVRASGPALASFGVPGTLPDPKLSLFESNSDGSSTLLGSNQGWGGLSSIASASSAVGAFSWPDPSSADSAVLPTLSPGAYTAEVAGAGGDTGVALVEAYDASPGTAGSNLLNISSRGLVGTAGNIMIAGFVVGGTNPKTVLLRASGPALASFGVAGVLADPKLLLYRSNPDGSSTLLYTNTGWAGDGQVSQAASLVGAFPWSSASSADSALLVTLAPGAYTAEVAGASGDTGVALVEVYAVP